MKKGLLVLGAVATFLLVTFVTTALADPPPKLQAVTLKKAKLVKETTNESGDNVFTFRTDDGAVFVLNPEKMSHSWSTREEKNPKVSYVYNVEKLHNAYAKGKGQTEFWIGIGNTPANRGYVLVMPPEKTAAWTGLEKKK